jgi:DNA helicase-2/ATP-dependent DNA helicase PcrA
LKDELARGTPVERIAYLTFTRNAAAEVQDRIGRTPKWFRTIHSACMAMLALRPTDIIGKREFNDLAKLGWPMTGERSYGEDMDQEQGYDAMIFAMSYAAHTMRPLGDVVDELSTSYDVVNRHMMRKFLRDYRVIKEDRTKYDYEDMLEAYAHADEPTPMPIDVLILDEAQDLSRLQWKAVHLLGAGAKRVYIAGDDDQSIFSFMGADEYGFLDHPCDEETVLERSFRCPPRIGRQADKVIRTLRRRRDKTITWGGHGQGSVVLDAPLVAPVDVERASKTGSVMYLTRHRRQASDFSAELLEIGIPHALRGESITCSDRAKAIFAYIRLKRGEEVSKASAAAMLVECGDRANARILRQDQDVKNVDKGMISHIMRFDHHWTTRFSRSAREIRENQFLHAALRKYGPEIIGQEPNINVSTMHGVKGQEADTVFVVTDCNARAYDNCQLQTPTETRLAFVALTRAAKSLIIQRPQTSKYLLPLAR